MWDPPPVLFLHSQTPPLRIFFAYLAYHAPSGKYPLDSHLEQLRPSDYVFIFPTWHRLGFDEERLRCYGRFPCQVILCANTAEEHSELQAAGVHSIYFNHNATLDERIFCITNCTGGSDSRPIRLLVNAAFEPFKRLHLAAHVPGAAWIGYWQPGAVAPAEPPIRHWLNLDCSSKGSKADESSRGHGSDSRSGAGQGASCSTGVGGSSTDVASSYRYLEPAEVAAALNRSMLGGVFSAEEGTCWASTEYLLCGLPVVSTPCRGGREVWYNERNSLIVEPTQAAVERAVEQGIDLLESGAFDRQQIRAGALQLVRQFRSTLTAEVQRICDQHGVSIDAAQHFTETFAHKMGLR